MNRIFRMCRDRVKAIICCRNIVALISIREWSSYSYLMTITIAEQDEYFTVFSWDSLRDFDWRIVSATDLRRGIDRSLKIFMVFHHLQVSD
jgi:hypothetical protein